MTCASQIGSRMRKPSGCFHAADERGKLVDHKGRLRACRHVFTGTHRMTYTGLAPRRHDCMGVGKHPPIDSGPTTRRVYSFMGGCLIGISVSLPAVALDAGEGGGALVLFGCLTLAATGIGMHVRGTKQTRTPFKESSIAAKGNAVVPGIPESP
jgi:hypothetical protein